jgi:hypothetical protein
VPIDSSNAGISDYSDSAEQVYTAGSTFFNGQVIGENNMRKIGVILGLVVLLLGTSATFAQSDCQPCEPLCSPCDPLCGTGSPFKFGGWVEFGVFTNSHGYNNNGPMHDQSRARTDFGMTQLYLYAEKEMDTRRGFDWGAKTEFVYGTQGGIPQCYDGTFDAGWGLNKHGYQMAASELYGTVGYKNLSVKAGKFAGLVGWEAAASKDNFFYSHSNCYWIEPATHMGVLGTYEATDRLSLTAGWTTGSDCSFENPYNGQSVLAGFQYALTDKANVHYYINAGKQYIDPVVDYFVQSLCLEWNLTDRFTYVMQYNLRNDNERGGGARSSAYGINNHFLYKLNDKWGVGTRFEWLRDNGSAGFNANPGDYYEISLGLNWSPWTNVSVRPEVRYDWCNGATPFGPSDVFGGSPVVDSHGVHSDQVSGGFAVVVSF